MKDSPRFAPTPVRQLQPETDWPYGFARVAYRHSQRRSASVVMPRMEPLCLATARSPPALRGVGSHDRSLDS